MKIDTILRDARKSVSRFCYEECGSYCCRKGYLVVSKIQADLISGNRFIEFQSKHIIKVLGNQTYSFYIGNPEFSCPSLKENKCMVHTKKNRPQACKEFPIFLVNNIVRFSSRCPAVVLNKFYPYIKKIMKLGYIID